jgi:hypothetical protein
MHPIQNKTTAENEMEVVARGPSEKYNSFFEVKGKILFIGSREEDSDTETEVSVTPISITVFIAFMWRGIGKANKKG